MAEEMKTSSSNDHGVEETTINFSSSPGHKAVEDFTINAPDHGGGNKGLMDQKRVELGLQPKEKDLTHSGTTPSTAPAVEETTVNFSSSPSSGIEEISINAPSKGGGNKDLMDQKRVELGLQPKGKDLTHSGTAPSTAPSVEETTINFSSSPSSGIEEISVNAPSKGGGNKDLMDRAKQQALQMLKESGHSASLSCTDCMEHSPPSQVRGATSIDNNVARK